MEIWFICFIVDRQSIRGLAGQFSLLSLTRRAKSDFCQRSEYEQVVNHRYKGLLCKDFTVFTVGEIAAFLSVRFF